MAITKVTKPAAPYQIFTSDDIGAGEILDVVASLGGHPARTTTFENPTVSGVSFRINVCEKVYQQYGIGFERQELGFQGSAAPIMLGEIEKENALFTIMPGSGMTISGFGVADIKLVTFADGAKITIM